MSIFIDRSPPPHPAAPLLQTVHLGPQSGVQGREQVHPGPAPAGEPAAVLIVGVAIIAAAMMRRRRRVSARLDPVTRRARAEVIRRRAFG